VLRFLAFLRLSRLKFLAGGIVGGALGGAVAAYETGRFAWPPFLLAQATVVAFHLMTHYANDYYDRAADEHAARTPFSGGSGALVDGSLPAWIGLAAALACAALGIAGCSALALLGLGLAAGLSGAIGILAWGYSAPPVRLLARGLGEIDGTLVVAILVPLCTYASQTGKLSPLALATTLPGGAAMFAMMLAVEYPDLGVDTASGKRNLIVRLGERGVLPILVGACAAIYAGVLLALLAGAPPALAILELLTLPLAWEFARAVPRRSNQTRADEAIAGRGVALFFVVSFFALLAFLAGRQFA
jgi:1,4-dihydroxy-2-naphthoate polyprenyltransferase